MTTEPELLFEDRLRLALHDIAEVAPRSREVSALDDRPSASGNGPRRPTALLVAAAVIVLIAVIWVATAVRSSPPAGVDTLASTSTIASAPPNLGPLPRFSFGYWPSGASNSGDLVMNTTALEPGWAGQWTRPNASSLDHNVDRIQVFIAAPGQAPAAPPNDAPEERTAATDAPGGTYPYDDGLPKSTTVDGHDAFVFASTFDLIGLDWALDDGTRIVVTGNRVPFADLTRVADAVRIAPARNPVDGFTAQLDPAVLPSGFTFKGAGRGPLFDQRSGSTLLGGVSQSAQSFEVRTISRPFKPDELTWDLDGPTTAVDGADGLHFIAGSQNLSPYTNNMVYGGRGDVTIRIQGTAPVDELIKIATGMPEIRETPAAPPAAGTSTVPSSDAPPPSLGTVVTTLPGGWIRYVGWAAAPGIPIPPSAWVIDPSSANGGNPFLTPDGPIAVYDQPRGTLIGYAYSNIGYVPASMAATFDLAAASEHTWGCDIRQPECAKVAFSHPPNISPDQQFSTHG